MTNNTIEYQLPMTVVFIFPSTIDTLMKRRRREIKSEIKTTSASTRKKKRKRRHDKGIMLFTSLYDLIHVYHALSQFLCNKNSTNEDSIVTRTQTVDCGGDDLENYYWSFMTMCNKNDSNKQYYVIKPARHKARFTDYLPLKTDFSWGKRILSLAHRKAAMISASAYISTLGGGYFLTRQLDQAQFMAKAQERVALSLGNLLLASQCRINLAYNLVSLGLYRSAYKAFVREFRYGMILIENKHGSDGADGELICAMARAAILYTRKTAKLVMALRKNEEPGIKVHDEVKTKEEDDEFAPEKHLVDNFYRQRPVLGFTT